MANGDALPDLQKKYSRWCDYIKVLFVLLMDVTVCCTKFF